MKRRGFLLALGLLGMAATAQAQMVLQLNLEQLTALSTRVFVGKCVSVKNETDAAGRLVQDVTYQVEEMLKGTPSEAVTFRQLAPATAPVVSGGVTTVQDLFRELPSYTVGEENIIFIGDDSRLGLNAPVGLFQGKFKVEKGEGDAKQVVNGSGNKGLFLGWDKSPKYKSMGLSTKQQEVLKGKPGSVSYAEFISLVKKLAQ